MDCIIDCISVKVALSFSSKASIFLIREINSGEYVSGMGSGSPSTSIVLRSLFSKLPLQAR